ncbi:MAG: hypothetical protein UGF43_07705 [Blautia sp.]|uniref:hypothetical protein n=1 Tax=Blautia sp. TaxID=1955243 RepID=UPI002E75CD4D|nr:hypothetical protein [Blautia sp.]MEE1443489.1 hypothetical protein [Blautia sp.]
MIQSNTINKLLSIYKSSKVCFIEKKSDSFYKCLKHKICEELLKNKEPNNVLREYKMSCKSYLDSDILSYNISIVTIAVSISTLIVSNMDKQSWMCVVNILCAFLMFISAWTIKENMKERKLREVAYVLETINVDEMCRNKDADMGKQ